MPPRTPFSEVAVHLHRGKEEILINIEVYHTFLVQSWIRINSMASGFRKPIKFRLKKSIQYYGHLLQHLLDKTNPGFASSSNRQSPRQV